MTLRTLGFAGLLLASTSALASPPEPGAPTVAAQANRAKASNVVGDWTVTTVDGQVQVRLSLKNQGARAATVMTTLGRTGLPPRAHGVVRVNGVVTDLVSQLSDDDTQRQMMAMSSRVGPMNRFAPLAAHDTVDLGTTTFALPEGADPGSLQVEVTVNVDGEDVVLTRHAAPTHES